MLAGMSVVVELILDLLFDVIGSLLEAWLGDVAWLDTKVARVLCGIVLVAVGGVIWWELH